MSAARPSAATNVPLALPVPIRTDTGGASGTRKLAEKTSFYELAMQRDVGREQAPRNSGSALAGSGAGTASPRLLVAGLHLATNTVFARICEMV